MIHPKSLALLPALLPALVTLLLAGCNDYNHYVLELKPDGDGLQRKLTAWRESPNQSDPARISALPAVELASIARLYDTRLTPASAKKQSFVARFVGKMPSDVGGSGAFVRYDTPLGSSSTYSERFRGVDDLETARAMRHKYADEAADLLVGWFQSELGKAPDYARLHAAIDRDLRRDLKNLADYGQLAAVAAAYDSKAGPDFAARAGQYVLERGYVTADMLPNLLRVWAQDDADAWARLAQRFVADRLGLPRDKPLPRSLDFLADGARARKSVTTFLSGSKQYRDLLTAWEAQPANRRNANPPLPPDVLNDLLRRAVAAAGGLHNADRLDVRLACAQKPTHTNGKWNADTGEVAWEGNIAEGILLPTLCYATWGAPNVERQTQSFGRVVLDGDALQQYALWYKGLTAEEAAEWDKFVADLRPDAKPKERLAAFRFTSERTATNDPRMSNRVRGLILPQMK